MYIRHFFDELEDLARADFWSTYRAFLGDDREPIARPVVYSLWVDYFEGAHTVEESWHEVAGPQEPRLPRLVRVLAASGPVPGPLKAPVYNREPGDIRVHDAIADGLVGSCFDIYGDLDRVPALRLLGRLRLSEDWSEFRALRAALSDPQLPGTGGERRERFAEYRRRGSAGPQARTDRTRRARR
jgi:hypothetical protein